MLNIREVKSEEHFEQLRAKEDPNVDYLYICKHTNDIKLSDNGELKVIGTQNQNAFSAIKVEDEHVEAADITDILALKAGDNVHLIPNNDTNEIEIKAHDTTYDIATEHTPGIVKSGGDVIVNPDGTMSVTSIPSGGGGEGGTVEKTIVKSSSTNGNILVDGSEVKVYELPEASDNLGGVKTTSNVTSVEDHTACPIIDGVPYYKNTDTTYSPATLGQGYGTCSTAADTAAKVVTLSSYTLTVGGIVSVKFTYAVPASATMNINSKGAKNIFYRGAAITAGIINAGDIATFIYDGTQYHLISIDKGIYNITAKGDLAFDANTAQNLVPTISTLAYWNGSYKASGTSNPSNLAYCNQGAFGKAATYNVDTAVTNGSANLITSGAVYNALHDCTFVNTANTDLNSYTTPGKYYFSGSYTPTNIPYGSNGFLIVISNNTVVIKQIWLRHGTPNSNDHHTSIRISTDKGATWGAWARFYTDRDFTNMTAATADTAGKAGLVPAPAAGKQASFLRGDGTWAVPTNTTYTLSSITGTLAVSKGGTGATTLTSGALLEGNGTSAVKTRAVTNLTAKGALGYTSSNGTNIPTLGTIAYWNGAYSGTTSNLAYCAKGAFGDAAIKGVTTSATSGSADLITSGAVYSGLSGKLNTSGGTLSGKLTLSKTNGIYIPMDGDTSRQVFYTSSTLLSPSSYKDLTQLVIGPAKSNTSAMTVLRGNVIWLTANDIFLTKAYNIWDGSDARLKTNEGYLDSNNEKTSKYISVWDNMQPRAYRHTEDVEKGETKYELGYYAQEVEEAIRKAGLTSEEFSAVKVVKDYVDDNEEIQDNTEYIDNRYFLSYGQCSMLTDIKLRQVVNEILPEMQLTIINLKAQVEELTNIVAELKGE